MNFNTCHNCGSDSYYFDGRRHCLACGAVRSDEALVKKQIFSNAFSLLRESRFDEAKIAFEEMIRKYPENTDAYWGRFRARYHITYLTTADGKSVPSCPTRSGANIFEDVDYRKAVEYADNDGRTFLQEQADYIKRACTASELSKNLVNRFTFGEVDPNDAYQIPPKKSKKPLVLSALVAFALLITVMFGFSKGLFFGTAYDSTYKDPYDALETTVSASKSTETSKNQNTTYYPNVKPNDTDPGLQYAAYENTDFKGRTFVLVGADGESDGYNSANEIYSEEPDAISMAVLERNELVQTFYNCRIKGLSSPTPANDAMTEVTANQHTIDIYTHHYAIAGTATGGNVYNLLDIGTRAIDFSKPWWDQAYVNSYTIQNSAGKDTLYSVVGDFALTAFDCTHAIVYNKTVFENESSINQIDLYELVYSKNWTMDAFQMLLKNVATDTNADGVFDSQNGDTVGWVRTLHATHGLHVASGLSIMQTNRGKLSFEVGNQLETWTSVMEMAIAIWAMPEGQTISYAAIPETVAGGNALFASGTLHDTLGELRYYDCEIGLLPYPLYSEEQATYAHYVDNHFYSYSIPTSVPDPDTVCDFFAVYAFHSQVVREAYMSVYTYNYCADEQSGDMLEIIFNTRTYDPAYLDASLEADISNMIQNTKNYVDRFAAARADTANDWITKFIAGIDDNRV